MDLFGAILMLKVWSTELNYVQYRYGPTWTEEIERADPLPSHQKALLQSIWLDHWSTVHRSRYHQRDIWVWAESTARLNQPSGRKLIPLWHEAEDVTVYVWDLNKDLHTLGIRQTGNNASVKNTGSIFSWEGDYCMAWDLVCQQKDVYNNERL